MGSSMPNSSATARISSFVSVVSPHCLAGRLPPGVALIPRGSSFRSRLYWSCQTNDTGSPSLWRYTQTARTIRGASPGSYGRPPRFFGGWREPNLESRFRAARTSWASGTISLARFPWSARMATRRGSNRRSHGRALAAFTKSSGSVFCGEKRDDARAGGKYPSMALACSLIAFKSVAKRFCRAVKSCAASMSRPSRRKFWGVGSNASSTNLTKRATWLPRTGRFSFFRIARKICTRRSKLSGSQA